VTAKNYNGDVKNLELASEGLKRITWAEREMPVLRQIKERFSREKPLQGLKLAACLHVTSETANLAITLKEGGAEVYLCASNPLSTQDDVAASLVANHGISTFAIKGEDTSTYYNHIISVLETKPHITMDDGADLVATLHGERTDLMENIIGGTEETTTGVIRLKSLADEGNLKYPVIAVNDADTKHFFDNRYGTGQSTLDGITRATNILWAGKTVVVIGYGWCGRGVAMRARGMGAQTIVCEVNHIRGLEAAMDGHQVMTMEEASKLGDIFITVTGGMKAIDKKHVANMKDGVLLANSGHFNVEIDIDGIEELSDSKSDIKPFVEEYILMDGRKINLLGQGRLINLAAAEGHPSAVMDMSFADQSLSAEYVATQYQNLEKKVYVVPRDIDDEIGRLKLLSMGIEIDKLTDEQEIYLNSWNVGT
jgi:adenosylhomocysteinase|tara:strand:+ start:4433 stop:5704 length:1272 start_codon:yes stop_codon:yes gene_type:complete